MFTRVLCICALCAFITPAYASQLIQAGDVYETFSVEDAEFRMTGGEVTQELYFHGGTEAVIEGGVIGADTTSAAIVISHAVDLTIRGGTIRKTYDGAAGTIASYYGTPLNPQRLTVEGTYFRVRNAGRAENNFWDIQGWLADGSFANLTYVHDSFSTNVVVTVNLLPGTVPLTPGDTNYDDRVDLIDLNSVHNNFGASGEGDSNQDGIVDLFDLNLVRNNFGREGFFSLPPENEVTASGTVPEPATVALLAIGSLGFLGLPHRKGRRSES